MNEKIPTPLLSDKKEESPPVGPNARPLYLMAAKVVALKEFEPLGAYSSVLFLALMHLVSKEKSNLQGLYDEPMVWRSRKLRDGSALKGGFVAGIRLPNGKVITALLEDDVWNAMRDLELLCDTLPEALEGTDTCSAVFDMIANV